MTFAVPGPSALSSTLSLPRLFLALLCIIFFAAHASAKLVYGTANLKSEVTEWYLGKFAFGANADGHISGQFTPEIDARTGGARRYFDNMPHSLVVSLYDDAAWERLEKLNKEGALCTERIRVAIASFSLRARSQAGAAREELRFDYRVPPRPNSHYTYALLSDCALENYPAHPPGLEYSVTFTNDGSHLPADEQGMLLVLSLTLLLVLVAGIVYSLKLLSQHREFSQVHLASLLVGAAIALQVIALLAQIAHVVKFQSDGLGFKLRHTWLALDFLSEITQLFSELVVAFVLICLAAGWMLSESFHVSRILFDVRAMGLLAGLTGLHLWLQYKGRVYENDFNHFHDYDHWPGLLLICLRAFLCLVFWLGMALSYGVMPDFVRRSAFFKFIFTVLGVVQKQRSTAAAAATAHAFSPPASAAAGAGAAGGAGAGVAGTNPLLSGASPASGAGAGSVAATEGFVSRSGGGDSAVASLFKQILLVGTVWFLAFPLATLLTIFVSPASRKVAIVSASLLTHAGVVSFLMYSFLWSTSRFFNASSLKNMGTVFAAALGGGGASKGGFLRKAAFD